MPLITSDEIRDIAVKNVEMFLNDKVPLSLGLAKQASDLGLNSLQIQRALEATNSIAYLKVLSVSPEDRTIEFDLCKYAQVLAHIATPTIPTATEIVKEASITEQQQEIPRHLTSSEQKVYLIKMAAIAENELQTLRDRSITIVPQLIKAALLIKEDKQGLEKLATICNGKEFSALTTLVYGERKSHADTGIFKKAELEEVKSVAAIYKEAQELVFNINKKQELVDRSIMTKQAILNTVGNVAGLGIGKTLATPFKPLANLAGNTVDNLKQKFGGSKGGMVAPAAKKFGLGGLAGKVGVGAFDASVYSPGIDKSTGASKDVWAALQRE